MVDLGVESSWQISKWIQGPNFNLKDSYANIKFIVDGIQVGKSPADLIVNDGLEILDAVTWTSGKSIEGIVEKYIPNVISFPVVFARKNLRSLFILVVIPD